MKIECTPKELKELIENKKETPVDITTDENLAKHRFLLMKHQECQDICKESQREMPKHLCDNKPPIIHKNYKFYKKRD